MNSVFFYSHKTSIILHHSVCFGFHASQNWHYSASLRLFRFPCVTKLALFYITPSVPVSMRHKTGIILHHAVCSGFHASQNWHYSTSLRLFRFPYVTKLALFYITPSVPVSMRHKTGIILHHSVCSGLHASYQITWLPCRFGDYKLSTINFLF